MKLPMSCIRHLLTIHQTEWSVYSALTTVEGLSHWWTPRVSGDPGEGGSLRFYFGDYYKEMRVIKNEPPTMLVWRCTEGVPEWIDTVITFEIIKRTDDACQLLFNHDKWPPFTRLFYQCSYDWAMFLRSLKKYVETGNGHPYPNQHAWDVSETFAG